MSDCKLDAQLLTDCDRVLSKCGRPMAPAGVSYVEIPFTLVYNVLNTAANPTIIGTKEVVGPTEWRFSAISIVQSGSAYVRIQLPNGRFLSNYLMDVAPDAWSGSFRRAITADLGFLPGTKFRITTDVSKTGTAESQIAIALEGAFRFALRQQPMFDSGVWSYKQVAAMPRYYRTPNGNIMAPEWALDLENAEIAAGWEESEFRMTGYSPSTDSQTATILTPGGQATLQLLLNSRFDYQIRRLTFETAFTDGVTGTLSVIPRDSSGFSLTTDYVPVDLLQAAPYAHHWVVDGALSIFFDFQLSDTVNSGSCTFSVNAVVARRRKQS